MAAISLSTADPAAPRACFAPRARCGRASGLAGRGRAGGPRRAGARFRPAAGLGATFSLLFVRRSFLRALLAVVADPPLPHAALLDPGDDVSHTFLDLGVVDDPPQ